MTQHDAFGRDAPDRRKHGYKELEEKLDGHVVEIENRFRRFFIMALVAFSIIGVTSAAALFGYGILLREQGSQSDQIQEQRRDSVLDTCTSQNDRHDKTVAVLDKVFADVKDKNKSMSKEQKAQIDASRQYNLLLINALAPKQNCQKVVDKAVPESAP